MGDGCGVDAESGEDGDEDAVAPIAAAKRRLVPISRTACGARSRRHIRASDRKKLTIRGSFFLRTVRRETRFARDAADRQRMRLRRNDECVTMRLHGRKHLLPSSTVKHEDSRHQI